MVAVVMMMMVGIGRDLDEKWSVLRRKRAAETTAGVSWAVSEVEVGVF